MGGSSRSGRSAAAAALEVVPDDEIFPPAELFPLDNPETYFARAHLPVRPADGEPTDIDLGGGYRIVWKKPSFPRNYPTLPYFVAPPYPPDHPPSPPPLSHFPPELGLFEPSECPLIPLPFHSPYHGKSRIFCGPGWNDQHSSPSAFYQTPPSEYMGYLYQPQGDHSQRNASIYYDRNQHYESYRYAHPLHHLSARDVAAYGAYPG